MTSDVGTETLTVKSGGLAGPGATAVQAGWPWPRVVPRPMGLQRAPACRRSMWKVAAPMWPTVTGQREQARAR